MPKISRRVTHLKRDDKRIPDSVAAAGTLLSLLHERGVTEEAGRKLQVRRQGGYCAADGWFFLIVWLSARPLWGMKTFWNKELYRHHEEIASLAGRRKLPSPASLSRLLNSAEVELLRPATPWMLTEVPNIQEIITHPAVQTYDTQQRGWHVFDLDPTTTVLRKRMLPEADDLPEPVRRTEDFAKPGYPGRKRGDLQVFRMVVQHAGTGLWIHAHLASGNGDGIRDFELALDAVVAFCQQMKIPVDREILRMDGGFGNVPALAACRERNVPFVTRLNRLSLLKNADFLATLRAATFERVPDSRSGPKRFAADLGHWQIKASRGTSKADGSAYEPLDIRVVACVFAKEGKAGRGRMLDGFQVELFAVDLPEKAWPANEAVALYYGRCGQENRFAQEDAEFGLDRVASYNLAGQELATLTGLMLWNLQIVEGFQLNPPPPSKPKQAVRCQQETLEVPPSWPRDPVLQQQLSKVDWQASLATRPGWSWDKDQAVLRCPDGRELNLTSVRSKPNASSRTGIKLRRPSHGCEACKLAEQCLPKPPGSTQRTIATSKTVEFTVSERFAQVLRDRLGRIRAVDKAATRKRARPPRPGGHEVVVAPLLPAKARKLCTNALASAALTVDVELGEEQPSLHDLLAASAADRQRRRLTWKERWEMNALPDGSTVDVRIRGSDQLLAMLARVGDRGGGGLRADGRGGKQGESCLSSAA